VPFGVSVFFQLLNLRYEHTHFYWILVYSYTCSQSVSWKFPLFSECIFFKVLQLMLVLYWSFLLWRHK
jgi:hypothetical protein